MFRKITQLSGRQLNCSIKCQLNRSIGYQLNRSINHQFIPRVRNFSTTIANDAKVSFTKAKQAISNKLPDFNIVKQLAIIESKDIAEACNSTNIVELLVNKNEELNIKLNDAKERNRTIIDRYQRAGILLFARVWFLCTLIILMLMGHITVPQYWCGLVFVYASTLD